ncbi:hypothetical protein BO71DRAFT_164028 [Aspergillus ellipticus CBS 707.79]|uniref:D-xylose reductase [NAD(P)H] n=1 Tax=Aspergillus ellipticus CBS 707.79 TaxID=1448320 RepID=A0A319EY27_9EURO|nr:hypothetical protein BO71DRAFT_164028 [Aspergillus ellipticus CBS 707.79]
MGAHFMSHEQGRKPQYHSMPSSLESEQTPTPSPDFYVIYWNFNPKKHLAPLDTSKMALPNMTEKRHPLNTGASISAIGLGTWQSQPGEVGKAVEAALRAGYRHIDTAAAYGNEAEVGDGIKASGVPREDR